MRFHAVQSAGRAQAASIGQTKRRVGAKMMPLAACEFEVLADHLTEWGRTTKQAHFGGRFGGIHEPVAKANVQNAAAVAIGRENT